METAEKRYSMGDPPDWLKSLPAGARRIGIETFNAVLDETGDEDAARQAAWRNIELKYRKVGEEWVHKSRTAEGTAVSLKELRPIVLIPDYVSLVGSLARDGKGEDVDVAFKDARQDDYAGQLVAEDLLGEGTAFHAHWLPFGPRADHIPLYDLALVPKANPRRRKVGNGGADSYRYHALDELEEQKDGDGASGYFVSLKASEELQTVWGVVMVPHVREKEGGGYEVLDKANPSDTQRQAFTEGGIQRAMHRFNAKWMGNEDVPHLQHRSRANFDIVESYQAPQELDYGNGNKVPKGTWIMALKIKDGDTWQKVKRGEFTGLSPKVVYQEKDVVPLA